ARLGGLCAAQWTPGISSAGLYSATRSPIYTTSECSGPDAGCPAVWTSVRASVWASAWVAATRSRADAQGIKEVGAGWSARCGRVMSGLMRDPGYSCAWYRGRSDQLSAEGAIRAA